MKGTRSVSQNIASKFWPMRVATLKNRKKVHTIFGITSIKNGKAKTRKNGFYAVYCNKSDAPSRKPDSYWFGDNKKDLAAYWINRGDVKSVKGARRDGTVFMKTKDDFDTFCGKTMTEF